MKRSLGFALPVLAALALGCGSHSHDQAAPRHGVGGASSVAEAAPAGLPAADQRPVAPGFEGATSWLNVDRPLTPAALKGRVVVVDFWTSCCINCLQTLPTLKALEASFAGQPVVVVGVHSPKFDTEQDADRLRSVVESYGITHPVAVDANMAVWRAWGVDAWPTVLVLDAQGRVVWHDTGEPDAKALSEAVSGALAEGRSANALASGPLEGLAPDRGPATPLAFPGKVTSLTNGGYAIADTGHNRVVVFDKDGRTRDVVGSGLAGALDGGYADASFRAPQGVTNAGNVLYVADTENHLVRAIDLDAKRVRTIAGTGELGQGFLGDDETPATRQALRSPWDVLKVGNELYVALAGSHQIGVLSLDKGTIRRFAGSGREARRDGPPAASAFAQPSALASDGHTLYVLDSETSSVRAVDLATRETRTVVGKDLFVFGDVDGNADTTRLRHPLGLAFADGALWVADTYNSKVKRIDPKTGETRSIYGGTDHAALFEPGGLAVAGRDLLVADTHHQRLVRLARTAGKANAEPVALTGLSAPSTGVAVAARAPVTLDARDPEIAVRWAVPKGGATARLVWTIPEGTALNEEAPFKLRWVHAEGLAQTPPDRKSTGKEAAGGVEVPLSPRGDTGRASLEGVLDLVICDVVTHKVCVPVRRNIRATVEVGGEPQTRASLALPSAKP